MDIFDLSNEIAVVLGAGGALGGAMAEGLAEAGAGVAILDFAVERGQARAKSIADKGRRAVFVQANALDRASLRAAHEAVTRELGAPTILVNAVGGNDPAAQVTEDRSFENLSAEAWRANFDLNLCGGVLFPCQEFGAAMVKRGRGSIINIASVSAHIPLSRVVAYSAAKAAVLNLTRFLAREWATKGVRVNSITPGFFPADQNRRLLFNADGSPTPRAKAILDHTPMRRMGEPSELIGAVIFLASDKASGFVTGADIRVDGGFLAQTI
ncbi:MAG: SDR family oxidoreductase [Verrucomicrobiota bacterium]|nr:SDR family oxidoreductase [Verrucomicrobiota bacterium]